MSKKIRHISDLAIPLTAELADRCDKPKELAIDILPNIDRKLYGFKKKKLITIAGRPSMGKSALLMSLAYCFSRQGKKGMFFNLETTNLEFMERLYSYSTRTNNFEVTTGQVIKGENYANNINAFVNDVSKSSLYVAESYGKTFQEILTVIEKTGDDYDFICIDYLQKIHSIGKSERENLDRYLNSLCDLAIDKDICIILGSQISRGTYDGKKVDPPMLHELKGSGGIEEKSHQVWLLHWAWWYNNEDHEKNDYRIHIAKNKDGRTGIMPVKFQPEYYRIYEEEYVND